MTLAVVVYRVRVEDTPEFRSLAEAEAVERSPVRAALRGHWRMITVSAVLNLVVTMMLGVLVNYMSVYLLSVLGVPALKVYWLSAVCLFLGAGEFLVGGWWTDDPGVPDPGALHVGGGAAGGGLAGGRRRGDRGHGDVAADVEVPAAGNLRPEY
ncbi:hypothetical protein [Streptomyces sp. NPDC004270]